MTQPQTLSVEYQELMARADELENLLPPPPGDPGPSGPASPCLYVQSIDATVQLSLSADNIRTYLSAGQREWNSFAQSLREAAKAFEETDETSGDAISGDGTGASAATAEVTDEGSGTTTAVVTPTSYDSVYSMSKTYPTRDYYEVSDPAYDVGHFNNGVSCDYFATQWTNYASELEKATYAFRPFQYWQGTAASAVESSFDQQRSWLLQMMPLCTDLAAQANMLASATRTLYSTHPTYTQVTQASQKRDQKKYRKLTQKSEEALAQYTSTANLPLSVTQPPLPPSAPGTGTGGGSDLPWDNYPGDGSGIGDGGSGTPDNGLPADGLPTTPTNPAAGLPTNTDTSPNDAALSDASTGAPDLSMGSGVKPASFAGGGIGGGMPSMPLQAPMEAESAPRAVAARTAGLGAGIPGAGGALGGRGGMGMAPMGAGAGQGQGQQGKGKRLFQDDQALYTEKRPWTSAIIGNRRRNDAPDSN